MRKPSVCINDEKKTRFETSAVVSTSTLLRCCMDRQKDRWRNGQIEGQTEVFPNKAVWIGREMDEGTDR